VARRFALRTTACKAQSSRRRARAPDRARNKKHARIMYEVTYEVSEAFLLHQDLRHLAAARYFHYSHHVVSIYPRAFLSSIVLLVSASSLVVKNERIYGPSPRERERERERERPSRCSPSDSKSSTLSRCSSRSLQKSKVYTECRPSSITRHDRQRETNKARYI